MSTALHMSSHHLPAVSAPPPLPTDEDEVLAFPASVSQRRFWVLDRLEPGNPSINIAVRFRLVGPLDHSLLAQAIQSVIARHEILRTTFAVMDGEPMQVVAPALVVPLMSIDLRDIPADRRSARADALVVEDATKPFDLTTGPLLRTGLLRLDDLEHMFLITIHHAVCDGWSVGIMIDEIAAFYAAAATGQPVALRPLPIQYADFALWQNEELTRPAMLGELDYWKRQLANLPYPEVMTDHPRQARQTFNGDILSVLLPKPLTQRLKDLATREGSTLFAVFLSAFDVLLHRYTGGSEVVVGSPIVGRRRVEVEPLVGLFINTLILRTDVSGDPPFTGLLARVTEMITQAFAHQDLPYAKVVEALNPRRELSRNPLFQVNFIYQRDFIRPVEFAGISLTAIPSKSPGAALDLNCFLVERDEGWRFSCEYNTDLFRPETICRLLGHFSRLLEEVVADPSVPISRIDLLLPEERAVVLRGVASSARPYPHTRLVHQLVEDQAERTPGRVAVVAGGRSTTYRELVQGAQALAGRLRAQGIGPGALVAVCLPRTARLPETLLAVLMSGAAYVPLDARYPAVRVGQILEDAKPALVLTERTEWQPFAGTSAPVWYLDEAPAPAPATPVAPPAQAGPEDLAYVIFTSGSTGRPKGVQLPHRAVVNFLWSMRTSPGITPDDAVVAITTVSFDIAVLELFAPLVVGARVVVADRDSAVDGKRLAALMAATGVTILQATPVTMRMLIESGWTGGPTLKLLVGGEAVSRDLADQLLARSSSVWNMYGPTETTVWSSVDRIEPGHGPVLMGTPVANTSFLILDAHRQPVPIGAPGDLYIGGHGLARGYLGRPELTAERFIPDPFANDPTQLVYATGDVARFLADGRIEFLGRSDNQVKIRGFRIELGEIEAALASHPAVHQAVVVARGEGDGRRLVAWVMAGPDTTPAALRAHLTIRLPDYMIPSVIVPVDAFPLTPNGKVDRARLPEPVAPPADPGPVGGIDPYLEPLLAIWRQVLKVPGAGLSDDFYAQGGHSLLAIRLLVGIKEHYQVDIPLASFIVRPTVANLAEHLMLARQKGPEALMPAAPSILLPLQTKGSRTPFFFVGGFLDLARHVGPDQPFYGLDCPAEAKTPGLTFDILAERCLAEIRRVQPKGPYQLGGHCFGAIVAFTIANHLTAMGEKTSLLALFDPPSPPNCKVEPRTIDRWRFHLRNLLRQNPLGQIRYIHTRLANVGKRMVASQNREEDVAMYESFDPKSFPGRIHLYMAQDTYLRLTPDSDPRLRWNTLAGEGIEVVDCPGDHVTFCREPLAANLGRMLSRQFS